MKKNYVKKCLIVSMALSMTVATVTFADTPTTDGYANEQETEAYTTGTPKFATQDETVLEETENPENQENMVKHYGANYIKIKYFLEKLNFSNKSSYHEDI